MIGVLLVNLGTPDAPTTSAVRRFLAEFLGDRRVLDLPAIPRALLLYGVILPFRPRRSARAYQAIWTPEGSPLRVEGEALARDLQAALGQGYQVELAMRYGRPGLDEALDRLAGTGDIVVAPLYPQYASSTTGSILAEVYRRAAARLFVPRLHPIAAFFDEPGFLDAAAEVARPYVAQADHVLMSFHGLPERQLRAVHPDCLTASDCCDRNRRCYRAQCFATARGLAARLELEAGSWTVAFQSRLGRTRWIGPYTERVLNELARKGVRRLAVICPSFVADCLETLEEIGIRGRRAWLDSGGEAFTLVPCVNHHPMWVEGLAGMIRRATPRLRGLDGS